MRKIFLILLIALISVPAGAETTPSDCAEPPTANPTASSQSPATVYTIYYFHGNRRCATCRNLESYTREAVEEGFAKKIEKGIIEFKPVNTDEKGNGRYIDDYGLYTKAVIVSKQVKGEEKDWKNLDKVWTLVKDKEKYIKYIRDEITAFME